MKDRTLALTAGAIGLTIAAIPVAQRLLLLPVYIQHGYHPLALLNRLCTMLVLPGKILIYRVWPPPEHYFLTWQLLCAAGFNFLLYSFLALLGLAGYRYWKRKFQTAPATTEPLAADLPASPDRRTFLATAATGAAGFTIIGTGLYSVLVEPGLLSVRRLDLAVPGLRPSLDGLRIAQLTDIHHDEWISRHHIREAVRLANSLSPDIVALTGDYVTSNPALIKASVEELSRLAPSIGTVAVMGNHDWWSDVKETRRQFAASEMLLIDNDRRFITSGRRLTADLVDEGLCLGGVGDFWEDAIEPEKSFYQVPANMPRILLSHNPDVAEQGSIAAGHHRIDLMLSGHTHGGQVRLPGLGTPIVPSRYGSKYSHGLVHGPGCRVNISSGIGMAMLPVRFNVRPEVVLITLRQS